MTARTSTLPDYVQTFVTALQQRTSLHIDVEKKKNRRDDRAYLVRGFQNANPVHNNKECLALSFSRQENEDPRDPQRYVYLDRLKYPMQERTGCTENGTDLLLAVLAVCDNARHPYICFVEDATAFFVRGQENSLFLSTRWLYLLGSGRSWYGSYGFEIDPLYASADGKKGDVVLAFGAELKREKMRNPGFTYDAINTERVKQRIGLLPASKAILKVIRDFAKVLQEACDKLGLPVPFAAIRQIGERWTVGHTNAFVQRYTLQSLGRATNHFINHVPPTAAGSDERSHIALVMSHFKRMCKRLTDTATPVLYDAAHFMRKPRPTGIQATIPWKDGPYTADEAEAEAEAEPEAEAEAEVEREPEAEADEEDEEDEEEPRGKAQLLQKWVAKSRARHQRRKQTRKRARNLPQWQQEAVERFQVENASTASQTSGRTHAKFPWKERTLYTVSDFAPTASYDGDSERSLPRKTRKRKRQAK